MFRIGHPSSEDAQSCGRVFSGKATLSPNMAKMSVLVVGAESFKQSFLDVPSLNDLRLSLAKYSAEGRL
jgi:hypothetical protein